MPNEILEIKAAIQIQKNIHEVFEAIVDPAKMGNYFIAKGSGRMEDGKLLLWQFPEFDMEIPVKVIKVETDKYISFNWDGQDGEEKLVEINLSEPSENNTLIKATEKSSLNDEKGIKWLKENTEGWANFLACLKAYVEYNINLRKGAFEFMKKSN